ncbi:bleomycin resistance protein [Ottowia sp.]|uniref:bleomycin resistance protein n=1 Tax=Ottowia sp. TaxID=1898956 RepID=UPI003A85FA7A
MTTTQASARPSVQATIPVLASLDMAESTAFYVERLGFDEKMRTSDYLIVARDGCEIHFWLCADRAIAEQTSCYVRGDTRALHADFVGRGLTLAPPVERPWGMRELYVTDPHGNLVKFGEPV